MSRIAVVGGGIAGLTAAYRLSAAHDVVVFEREAVAGGKIRSQQIAGGYVFEWGPSGFLASADEVNALVTEIGLADALTAARPAAKNRFIYWNGRLHQLPAKPPEALKMSLLSPLGKLRAARELFVPVGDADVDESVLAFMQRRFGREVAERLVAPALLGISGGDAATTSMTAIFPRVRAIEAEHGSVLRGLMKGPRRSTGLVSFANGGMQTLTDRLAERLGDRLRTGVSVHRLTPLDAGWRIAHDGGETVADAVLVATPSDVAARRSTASASSPRAIRACACSARSIPRRSFPNTRRPARRTYARCSAARRIRISQRSIPTRSRPSCAPIYARRSALRRRRSRSTRSCGHTASRSTRSRIRPSSRRSKG
jgi:oxygen-dependent protoporphyrinogen oxidase